MRALVLLSLLWVTCVWGHQGDHQHHHPHPTTEHPHPHPTSITTLHPSNNPTPNKPGRTRTIPGTTQTNPTTKQTIPGTAQTIPTQTKTETSNQEKTDESSKVEAEVDEEAVRDKRQWFPPNYSYENFLKDYPRNYQGRDRDWENLSPRDRYLAMWARYWRPDIPMSEIVRYMRFMEERWQHNEWLWDQWRKNRDFRFSDSRPSLSDRDFRYPDSRPRLPDDPRLPMPGDRPSLSRGDSTRSGSRDLPSRSSDFFNGYPNGYPDARAPWRRPNRPFY